MRHFTAAKSSAELIREFLARSMTADESLEGPTQLKRNCDLQGQWRRCGKTKIVFL
jgi:hypothetical protein